MGTERRKSSGSLKLRLSLPAGQRHTLIPCPVCKSTGVKNKTVGDGRYSQVRCNWCLGEAFIERKIFNMFIRWKVIHQINVRAGKCKKGEE